MARNPNDTHGGPATYTRQAIEKVQQQVVKEKAEQHRQGEADLARLDDMANRQFNKPTK